VIIRDEIPLFLDLCTLKPGASSHPYELEIVNSRTLKFTFDNILLPDSTTNEPLSNGYVTYEIAQVKDLPLGTVITNDAAIYFDFNAPIITNETMHTIAEDFILVSLLEVESNSLSMQVVPNPTSGYCQIDLVGTPIQSGVLQLLTAAGQLVYQQTFQGQQIELDVSRLPKGLYWFTLATKKGQYARGKIAVK
ncbi:MAG: T9SS type A sorting domain-containing protein, partial [Bacteroidota bacterium]